MAPAPKVETAQRYLARGWSILPLRGRDKRPLIVWEPLQSSRPSAEVVTAWFSRWPDANIGIVTGEISNLIVLDIDPKHGGNSSLDRLERQFGQLPETIEAITGGEGRHLYFAHPGGLIRNRTGLAQGVDLRGDGGYIVAPPSVHPSGRPYVWAAGRSPEDIALAALPRWILPPSGGARPRRTLSDWRRLVHDGVPKGQRNSSIASLAGHLLWHQVDPEVVLELLLAWNRLRCHHRLKTPKSLKSFPTSFGFTSMRAPVGPLTTSIAPEPRGGFHDLSNVPTRCSASYPEPVARTWSARGTHAASAAIIDDVIAIN